ncbi:maltase A1-like [Condylostylus longicornis]|uniref:maltase A1-like n=1 Tax=Condylostylus longicornis TaxID=2530218 RepID=UPI00244E1CDC|nr:maltase A1-like [Condylostylus longicornis]
MKLITAILLLATIFYYCEASAKDWWINGNFYQIYPRSFMDSDGDGIGDLNGITQRLPYVKSIGMTGAWLSPMFQSPMADFGYDISNYYEVQPEYGTKDDFRRLLEKAHELGLKIFLDFVPNHTSDEHEWFQKSIKRIEPYTDYYVWHDGKIDQNGTRQPPNNWRSDFRYSAWEWNDERQQYYLHQFGVKQPDLNYRNPKVVAAMKDVLTFWLDQGVDGFRIDALPYMFEIEADQNGNYPDEPINTNCPNPDDNCHTVKIYTKDQPETFEMVYQWRELCDEYKKKHGGETRILMTESYTSLDNNMKFYGNGIRNGSQIPFNFEIITKLNVNSTAQDFANVIDSWLVRMPSHVTANWVLGNHDNHRVASRFGPERTDLLNILAQTLPGNAVTYNGEELGLTDVYISWEDSIDPQACNSDPDHYFSFSRDPARTPFQWDDTKNSGFSTANKTWLPVADNYSENNVKLQLLKPRSHLKVFLDLVQIRKHPSFQEGDIEVKVVDNVLVYKRENPGDIPFIVVLNLDKEGKNLNLRSLFPRIADELVVVTNSVQSEHNKMDRVKSDNFYAEPNVGSVLVSF